MSAPARQIPEQARKRRLGDVSPSSAGPESAGGLRLAHSALSWRFKCFPMRARLDYTSAGKLATLFGSDIRLK
jgi:hypothetical protein